ncbi:MAG: M23 family metallopeptidase [Desulfuromonadaceae bacterium]
MKRALQLLLFITVTICTSRMAVAEGPLSWPIACVPGVSCLDSRTNGIGYPDIGTNAETLKCRTPAYKGHTGTDIYVTSVDSNVPVMAAANGEVMWVQDGLYDRCPNADEADCKPRITPICSGSAGSWGPDTTLACNGTACDCLWGFNAGNFVLIRHDDIRGIAFTLYAHLQKGSISVSRGQTVSQGDYIARVGSSGNALRPHLHFGVWRTMVGSIEVANPWGSKCDTDQRYALWASDPPFLTNFVAVTTHSEVVGRNDVN